MANEAAARGQEVRDELLAAAAQLIPERGWAAVSTRVLAERAGVSPSVVHYHFPSLSAVLSEAVTGRMREVLDEFDATLDTAREPADAVEAMLGTLRHYTGADPTSLLFIEAYLASTRDGQLRERLADIVDGFRQRLGRWLNERGIAAPEETAAVLMAAVDGLLLHRGLGADPDIASTTAVLRRLVQART